MMELWNLCPCDGQNQSKSAKFMPLQRVLLEYFTQVMGLIFGSAGAHTHLIRVLFNSLEIYIIRNVVIIYGWRI